MYQDILSKKQQIKEKRDTLIRRTTPIENEINSLEIELKAKIKIYSAKIVENVFSYLMDICERIEYYDTFKFDGYKIERDVCSLKLYLSKDNVKYQIILKECQFVFEGNLDEDDTEDMNEILKGLNTILTYID